MAAIESQIKVKLYGSHMEDNLTILSRYPKLQVNPIIVMELYMINPSANDNLIK